MPKHSWIWEYYTTSGNSSVKCVKCDKKLKYDKCTTNLIKHMKVHDIFKDTERNTIIEDGRPYEGNLF